MNYNKTLYQNLSLELIVKYTFVKSNYKDLDIKYQGELCTSYFSKIISLSIFENIKKS